MSDEHGGHDPEHPNSDHGHSDHRQASDVLGPIDLAMWGVGLLGVALGLLVALCCAFAVGMLS